MKKELTVKVQGKLHAHVVMDAMVSFPSDAVIETFTVTNMDSNITELKIVGVWF